MMDKKPPLMRRASTGFIDTQRTLPKPRLPSRESFGCIESYKKLEKLGEGTYATVFKGIR